MSEHGIDTAGRDRACPGCNHVKSDLATLGATVAALDRLTEDRYKRMDDRFKSEREAWQAALAGQKALTDQAAESAKEAMKKSDSNLHEYKQGANEMRTMAEDQGKLFMVQVNTMMPRKEAESAFASADISVQRVEADMRQRFDIHGKEDAMTHDTAMKALQALTVELRTLQAAGVGRKEIQSETKEDRAKWIAAGVGVAGLFIGLGMFASAILQIILQFAHKGP